MSDRRREQLPSYAVPLTAACALLGLALTTFMVYVSFSYASQKSTYDAAPVCASAGETAQCRFDGSAVVIAKRSANTDRLVDLTFAAFPGKTYTGYFTDANTSFWQWLQQGSVVVAELWKGTVTVVAGAKTRGNPDNLPASGPGAAVLFGAVTLLVLAFLVYLTTVDRRSANRT